MNGRLARWIREEIRLRHPTGLRPTHWVRTPGGGNNDRILVSPRRQAKKAIIRELRGEEGTAANA